MNQPNTRMVQLGEPAPWFTCRTSVNPRFLFDSVAGRYVVLSFFGSGGDPISARMLAAILEKGDVFNDDRACFFGVSNDPQDEASGRVKDSIPGFRFFWDFDLGVSRQYGIVQGGPDEAGNISCARLTLILDERLRVIAKLPLGDNPEQHVAEVIRILELQPSVPPDGPAAPCAPVLVVPRVFESGLCERLIQYYDERGGQESGFVRDKDGMTVTQVDHHHKRRRDEEITDDALRKITMHRVHDCLVPEVHKAFQFRATRIERYIVACYDGETGGFFRAHRDNTTRGTAHRRFAVSINLNGDFDGGELRFPEFGRQTYRPPAGGAVVFSCSLLHEATPITRGRRFAFLPFLYDDEAARIREQNMKFVQG